MKKNVQLELVQGLKNFKRINRKYLILIKLLSKLINRKKLANELYFFYTNFA